MTGLRFSVLVICLVLISGYAGAAVPAAEFSGSPTSGDLPLLVTFTDESSGDPTGWGWFFGDETYTQSWVLLEAFSDWAGRDWFSSVAMPDGSVVLTGGWNTSNMADVWISDDGGLSWSLVNNSPGWPARHAHSSVALPDGSIVLTGGLSGGSSLNDTWQSADKGETWAEVNGSSGWMARGYHSSVALNDGSILLTGGRLNDGSRMNDTWRSTDNGATWILMNASSGWGGRSHHSTVTMPDGTVVLTGGYNGTGDLNDTWLSIDNGASWKRVNRSSGWTAREGHTTVAMADGSIVLIGGGDFAGPRDDVWRSTDKGATWTQLPDGGWPVRGYHASVVMPDSSILMMGGYDGITYLNDTWLFQPAGSNEQNPEHTYTAAGTYDVALQASNSDGSGRKRKSDYISVTEPIVPMTGNGTMINQGAPVFIGESGLNVTHALNLANSAADIDAEPTLTMIGWWADAGGIGSIAPTVTYDLGSPVRYRSMTVDPAVFVSYPGNWYLLAADNTNVVSLIPVFTVQDPSLDIAIWDFDQAADVTGDTVPYGNRLGFRIDTNMYLAAFAASRSPLNPATDGFITIVVKNESDYTYTTLYNASPLADPLIAGPHTLANNFVDTQPYYWGSAGTYSWMTNATDGPAAYIYKPGTYTVWAESTLNHMKDNYKAAGGADYTGKTVSPAYTVTLSSSLVPQALLFVVRDVVVEDDGNSLPGGNYNGFTMNHLIITHLIDGTGTSFGSLDYALETSDQTWVEWPEYAEWNGTHASWSFPGDFTIPENEHLGVEDATSISVPQALNASLNRQFNETRFNETGFQLVSGNFSFAYTPDIITAGLIVDMPLPDERVNATIVAGSVTTDAPQESTFITETGAEVWLNSSALVQGKVYNYSAEYRVEPNGTAIRFEPMVKLDVCLYGNLSDGPVDYGVEVPAHVLPETITAASVSTDTLSHWQFVEEHWVMSRLNQRADPLVTAGFTADVTSGTAPLEVSFNDTSTGSPDSWNWSVGDGTWINTSAGNISYTYTTPGTYTVTLIAGNAYGSDTVTKAGYITVLPGADRIGVFMDGLFALDADGSYSWNAGDHAYTFGSAGDTPVSGDWNNDGRTEIGVFNSGVWYLDYNDNGAYDGPVTDRAYSFGTAGYMPIVGDWNGDGADKIGVEANGVWAIDYNGNGAWDGTTDDRFAAFGQTGDIPVVGDWNGDGADEIGSHLDGFWAIDYNGNYQWDGTVDDRFAGLGLAGDKPVIGDWTGDGKDEIGMEIYGFWAIDYNGDYVWEGIGDDRFAGLGQTGDTPVVGDWDGDGSTEICSFVNGFWAVDYNGNYAWDGVIDDRFAGFGGSVAIPVAGVWS